MARRSDHSREELFERTADAVTALVEAHGYPNLTMRKVAETIGYSVGTLYNLFDNLDDMILTANGRTLDALDTALANAGITGAPEADLAALLDRYLAFTAERPGRWSMLYEHTMKDGDPIPDWYQAKVARVMGRLEAALTPLFAGANQDDIANAIEKKRGAQVLWAGLHGIWSLAQTGKLGIVSTEPAAVLARNLVETYVAGLKTRLDARRSAGVERQI
ncbi:MAG: TetR/AcrR family transcriptional regulator [Alphaproteobacteria bacterium]|nr:TetR/AcrR family transcriptional regulator [Alphaproteobacteria bacterium]